MKTVLIYICFAATLAIAKCNYYTIENPTISYYNPKYMKDPVYTVTKNADDETYTIHMEGENLIKFDDKITLTLTLLTKVDDQYQPTGLSKTFKLCKFFEDPFGKLLLQQLPSMKCPFPAQKHTFTFKSLALNQIPFAKNLDSSWKTGVRIEMRMDTDSKESIIKSSSDIKLK
ncbi:uncharacterized protein LOC113235905 [Hyposmocoma kahamanoa]|uniref:uncharacterized protein LOC113235905 n=1 Tax=Hyposmocoma kahamanoa TaxID=1477025 RepID=UPI000E6D61FB|nr:uncharacterized protein LOC113235905 [Hyposmocoma kahamanoa]